MIEVSNIVHAVKLTVSTTHLTPEVTNINRLMLLLTVFVEYFVRIYTVDVPSVNQFKA